MKKLWIIGAALLLSVGAANAQKWNELQGPAAKNQKPSKSQAKNVTAAVRTESADLKGPALKNQNPWNQNFSTTPAVAKPSVGDRVTGPKAKNKRP